VSEQDIVQVKFVLRAQEMWRAVAFWRDAFGLHARFGDDEWTELPFGHGAMLVLRAGHDGSRRTSNLSIDVGDIDEAVEAAQRAGARVLHAPHRPAGQTFQLAELIDPEGNVFRLTEGA
jgi:predicted enzyme related to lactoylglutathione lyase